MLKNKKIFSTLILISMVVAGLAAMHAPGGNFRNLKVLPQDISDQKLDSIMDTYCTALGVDCKFCHSSYKNFPDSLDFAADDEPMKENARNMMRMTILVNKTYFYFDREQRAEYLNTVNCKTCHRGEPIPPE